MRNSDRKKFDFSYGNCGSLGERNTHANIFILGGVYTTMFHMNMETCICLHRGDAVFTAKYVSTIWTDNGAELLLTQAKQSGCDSFLIVSHNGQLIA